MLLRFGHVTQFTRSHTRCCSALFYCSSHSVPESIRVDLIHCHWHRKKIESGGSNSGLSEKNLLWPSHFRVTADTRWTHLITVFILQPPQVTCTHCWTLSSLSVIMDITTLIRTFQDSGSKGHGTHDMVPV